MLEVKKKCCNLCLFSKNKVVSDKRKKQLLDDIEREGSYFACHESTAVGGTCVCRGFYNTETANIIRISQRLNMIEFVD